MTCIAGLVHEGVVYIGGDSAGVADFQITRRADAKVFRKGPYVFGFTDSFRMGQLLHYSFKPPAPTSKELSHFEKFMVTRFMDAVRNCLREGGYAKVQDKQEEGGTFLVGAYARLFNIGSDYQVGEALDRYDAVGAGEDIAKGALYALRAHAMPPEMKLRVALEASERWCSAVCSPFNVVSTTPPRVRKKKSPG
jgi:hypothetical protein